MDQSLESVIKSRQQERREKKQKKSFRSGAATSTSSKALSSVSSLLQKNNAFNKNNKKTLQQSSSSSSSSIFDRLGDSRSSHRNRPNEVTGGTKVNFDGLQSSVSKKDITELGESIGEVKNVIRMKSTNEAEVFFAKRSDAITAVKKLNGLTLDGHPMRVYLAGVNGKVNPFDPNQNEVDEKKNVREGFFGTAMRDSEDEEEEETRPRRKKNVREGFFGTAVTRDASPEDTRRFRGGRGGKKANVREGFFGTASQEIDYGYKKPKGGGQGQKITVTIRNSGGRGAERATGGRGGRGGKGKGSRGDRRGPPKSAQDLDREMDEYLASR